MYNKSWLTLKQQFLYRGSYQSNLKQTVVGLIGPAVHTTVGIQRLRQSTRHFWMSHPKGQKLCVRYLSNRVEQQIAQVTRAHCSMKRKLTWFLSEPFVFGSWSDTEICSVTCGKKGKLLEQRSCTPAHPDKSCTSLPTNKTLRPGNKFCGGNPCKGNLKVSYTDQFKASQDHSPNGLTGQHAQPTARGIQTMDL